MSRTVLPAPVNSTTSKGVTLNGTSYTGTDDRVAKYTVAGAPSSGAAELKLENLEIMVQPGYTGDIVVKVGGTAGVTGEVTVAEVVAPVSVEVSEKKVLAIGKGGQAVGDIIITENKAGALDEAELILEVPAGTKWDNIPTVEVIDEGNLRIDEGSITRAEAAVAGDKRRLTFDIDSDSTTASKIKISGAKLAVDRTVPEGDLMVGVTGPAALNLAPNPWPNNTSAVATALATVGTPAGETGEPSTVATFTITSNTYKVGDTEQTMDVAPFVENGRAYVPIRYAVYAVGVSEDNIMWDGATATATLIKGDRVVQLTINSNKMLINGATITMDVPAKMVSGRTMLPVRWVGNALGCQVDWDEATQTVTVTQ